MKRSLRRLVAAGPTAHAALALMAGIAVSLAALSDGLSGIVTALIGLLMAGMVFGALTATRTAAELRKMHGTIGALSGKLDTVQAMPLLYGELKPPYPLPALGGWALDPGAVMLLARHIRETRPRLIVELGSGTSTVVLALLAREVGARLVSIEHDVEWAERGRERLAAWGLSEAAEVHHAPLTARAHDRAIAPWYDPARIEVALPGEPIDILLVDGPPKSTGRLARLPAVTFFRDRLSPRGMIMVDDYDREDERAFVRRWLEATERARLRIVTFETKQVAVIRFGTDEVGSGEIRQIVTSA